ncbi:MAG TPA: hypothetical protein VGB25_04410 [Candidatus Binatia bacterium]
MRIPATYPMDIVSFRRLAFFCCMLFLGVCPTRSMGEVYQWTDPNGTINFADNLSWVPDAVLNSSQWIVRRDLVAPAPLLDFQDSPEVSTAPYAEAPVAANDAPQASPPVGVPHTVVYAPQTTTIVVYPSASYGGFRKKPRHSRNHEPRGDLTSHGFGQNRYIHPSARTGTPRLAIHPEAVRSTPRQR